MRRSSEVSDRGFLILPASVGGSGNSSKLRGQRNQNQGALQKRERANIMITAAVVAIAVIIFLYITDRLPGILGDTFTRASIEAASVGGLVVRDPCRYHPSAYSNDN